jgi:hypothetical protein
MLGAALTVLLGLGALLVHDHRYFWYGDTPAAYYGWWYHLGEMVRHGQWATLDPHAWRAGNLAAEGQWGLWSPLVIGIALVATVAPNTLVLASAVHLGLAVVGALGVFRLARSYDATAAASYVAAVAAPMGGMTQYLDLPSWVAAEMIWALLPWFWWALRRTMWRGASPLPALALGYLQVTVGYVFGTIMLIVVLVACLLDSGFARDRRAALRVLGTGALLGLVALTVYLPGVLTASVTYRAGGDVGFGGKFSTDPLAMFTSLLPSAAVHGTTANLLPYAYLAWFLPLILWLDWPRVRVRWRPLAGLLFMCLASLIAVDGLSRLGPLRWPLRLQPFLVEGVVVLLVVAWHRFRPAHVSPRRLALSLAWVAVAGVVAVVRAPSMWVAHVASVALVGGGVGALWWLVRRGRRSWLAPAAAAVTLAVLALQHVAYPGLPSPQRNQPTELADYRAPASGAVGDVMEVGAADLMMRSDPRAAHDLLLAAGWFLNDHPVQNTYTTISQEKYKLRYCMGYNGDTCRRALRTLFSVEPVTGRPRVDLLGVSSLLLVRQDYPAHRLDRPPAGWRVARSTLYSVLWTRRTPVPGVGHVAWTSPGTQVSGVTAGDTRTTFRVDRVPSSGGTVVLSLLAWPGYHTDVGSLADPVDGYLVTVHLSPSDQGRTVDVGFHPPGWTAEVGAWALALVVGAGWCGWHAVRRRRGRGSAGR